MIVKEAPTSSQAAPAPGTRRISVLLVTDHLGHANGVIHGASRYYLQVLPRLDRARYDVGLCVLRERHPFADALEKTGIHPIFLNRSKWDPRAIADLMRVVRSRHVDVLHCLAMKGCLFGRLIGRITGTPALIHLHDTNDPGRFIGFLQRRMAPWTQHALAVSEAVRRYTISQFAIPAERVETLYNGLDLDAFAQPAPDARERVRRELMIPPAALVIMLAGRVVPTKGQRLLIELMPRILRQCPQAHLLIAGDGPDLPSCQQLVQRLGIMSAVSMPGQRSDMPDIVAAADIATMPSLQAEGFGYAALEAAAGGKPLVAFDGGAMREVIDDGRTGFIIEYGNREALADAIIRLAADPVLARAMGAAGALHAGRFGIDRHIRRLEALYSELSRQRNLNQAGAPR